MASLTTGRTVGGARLPILLLLMVLGSVAGASIWFALAGGHQADLAAAAGPSVRIHLDRSTPPAEPAPPDAPPRAAGSDTAGAAHDPVEHASPEPAAADHAAAEQAVTKLAPEKPAAPESAAPVSPEPVHEAASAPAENAARPAPAPAPAPAPEQEQRAVSVQPLPAGLTLPRVATGPPLAIAPDPGLVQPGESGLLPIIGADGRRPWRVYARPFEGSDRRPRIAIVVTDLGHSAPADQSAIQGLPGPVTLAFSPYSKHLEERIRFARAAGHEILIHLPMEPIDYPSVDPGPNTLLTSLSPSDNQRRLLWALGRGTGYVGVVSHEGSRFTADHRQMRPVLAALNERGLLFLDSRTTARSTTPEIAADIGLPWTIGDYPIDRQRSRVHIDARLRELEAVAKKTGHAVGIGTLSPVTLERIAAWVNGAERRGFVLAPISAVVEAGRRG